MSTPASDVISDLAAGRIDEARAADLLRQWLLDDGVLPRAAAFEISADAAACGLDEQTTERLLEALASVTRRHTAAGTAVRAPAPTLQRNAATGAATGVRETRLRPEEDEAASPAVRARSGDFRPGSWINDRFELQALVGRGGMGIVFSAVDRRKVEARDPNPQVALKILNAGFEHHPDAFIALQREASKAQTLAHPNIVTVFDFDRDRDTQRVFISMELLRGRSLEAVIDGVRGQGLDRKTALPIIQGMTDGLGYAHRKGIVHSDLKPANIFLLDDGTPKLLDFGIARAVPTNESAQRDQFDAGSLGAYTAAYATDEMVQGIDPAPADDIYALGIVIYELLTGRHPYGGQNAKAARAAGLAPAPLHALRRREWRTLARALAFERAKRPRDAAEFARLFFGAARLRNALIAAVLLLVGVSGYAWYRDYQQNGPAVPFEALPADVQQKVTAKIAEGEKFWEFYSEQGIADGLTSSVESYAEAFALHKGDRAAARGLKRAADEMLKRLRAGGDPDELQAQAQNLADKSEFLKTYPPVVDALGGARAAGAPAVGAPAAGAPAAGAPSAGPPSAGAPSAGAPAAGPPSAGPPSAGPP